MSRIPLDLLDDIMESGREAAVRNMGKSDVILHGFKHKLDIVYSIIQPYIDRYQDTTLCVGVDDQRELFLYIKVRLENGKEDNTQD